MNMSLIVICIVAVFLILMMIVMHKIIMKEYDQILKMERREEKFKQAGRMAEQWIVNLQNGKRISECFSANGFTKAGILGYNSYTPLVFEELQKEPVELVCIDDDYLDGLSPVPGLKMTGFQDFLEKAAEYDVLVDVFAYDKKYNEVPEPTEYRKKLPDDLQIPVVDLVDLIGFTGEL